MPSRIPIALVLLDESACATVLSNLQRQASLNQIIIISDILEFCSLAGGDRYLYVPRLVSSNSDGSCLCCGLNSARGDHLRRIFFQALANKSRKLAGVVVLSGQADPENIKFTLKHTPFLGQRYRYAGTLDVRVASAGAALAESLTDPSSMQGVEEMLLHTLH